MSQQEAHWFLKQVFFFVSLVTHMKNKSNLSQQYYYCTQMHPETSIE